MKAPLEFIRRFLAWWFAELAACVPRPVKALFVRTPRRLAVYLGEREARFALLRSSGTRDIGRVDLGDGDEASVKRNVAQRLRRVRTSRAWVALILDESRALRYRAQLPLAALENVREVVGFEMDRHTPFKADQVYYDHRIVATDRDGKLINVEVLFAPRAGIDPLVERLAMWGLRPAFIGADLPLEAGNGGLNLLPSERRRRHRLGLGLPSAILALLALGMAAVALYLPLKTFELERQLLDQHLAKVRTQARAVNGLKEQLAKAAAADRFLVERKLATPPVVGLLNELTRLLPDNTRLTRATLKHGKLTLSGYSASASALIALLERSEELTSVRFSSPVTNDPRLGLERFNITAVVRGRRN